MLAKKWYILATVVMAFSLLAACAPQAVEIEGPVEVEAAPEEPQEVEEEVPPEVEVTLEEPRVAAFVWIWTEPGMADEVAKETSTIRVVQEDQVIAEVRWAAPVQDPQGDAPNVIAGVSATDEAAVDQLVEQIMELPGLRNPQEPETVFVEPRYVEGMQRPHNGWP